MKSLETRIVEFNAHRQPSTLALKYKLMARDEFSFFRATCHLFYEDMAPRIELIQGPLIWACGDAHLENFGSYRAANELVYFDINDFDEAVLTHAPMELVRFLCSIGMAAGLWEYSMMEAKDLMNLTLQSYATLLGGGKAYAIQMETSPPLIVRFFEMAQREKEKKMVSERMDSKHDKLKIIPGKTMPVADELRKVIVDSVNAFLKERFGYLEVKDVAFRIAGTGSLGVKRYALLTYDDRKEKYRLLDIKASGPSSLIPFVTTRQPTWPTEAERIISIQSMMQYALPRFMGTPDIQGEHYVLKQLQPSSQKIDYRLCDKKLKNVETVMTVMAEALASAQLRSAYRKGSGSVEELQAFAADRSWQAALIRIAFDYAGVMKKYYMEYITLYKEHKMEITP